MRLHSLLCRAEKPTAAEKEEDESESDNSGSPRGFNRKIRRPTKPPQPIDPSIIAIKECTIVIKRTEFIERAIRKGYSSFTYVGFNWKNKTGSWVNTDQLGAGPGPKKRKI